MLRRRSLRATGSTLLVTLLAGVSSAQNSIAPIRLTLKDAVGLALKQNTDVQIANIDLASRQQDRNVVRADLLPQASLQATEEVSRYNLEALIGLQFAGVSKNVGPSRASGLDRASPPQSLT